MRIYKNSEYGEFEVRTVCGKMVVGTAFESDKPSARKTAAAQVRWLRRKGMHPFPATRAKKAKGLGSTSTIKLHDRYSGGAIWLTIRDGVVVGAMGSDPKRYMGMSLTRAKHVARYGGTR